MAALQCVLTAADSTSTSSLISHKPYLLSTPDNKEFLKGEAEEKSKGYRRYVLPSDTSSEMREKSMSETLTIPSFLDANLGSLYQRRTSYQPHSIERIRHEEQNSVAPVFEKFRTDRDSIYRSQSSHEKLHSPLYTKSFAQSGIAYLPRKRFESVPDYLALYNPPKVQSPRYEDVRRRHVAYDEFDVPSTIYSAKHEENCFCKSPEEELEKEQKTRPHAKARMKYTPIRHDIPYSHHGHLSTASQNRSESEDAIGETSRWLHGKFPGYDKKPLYLQTEFPKSPLAKEITGRPVSPYNIDRGVNHHPNDYHHDDEDMNGKRGGSAFSVIRPSLHRNGSERLFPPSSNPLKRSIEVLSAHGYPYKYRRRSYGDIEPNPFNRLYQRKGYPPRELRPSESNNNEQSRLLDGNKLHIYDEASKAALKAFDAHVEKMMAESRDKKAYMNRLHKEDDSINSSDFHRVELTKEKLKQAMTRDQRLSTGSPASSPQSLVQVSTVDSTQTTEGAHSVGGLLSLTMVANEHLGQAIAKEKRRTKNNNCLHLWQFLRSMLDQEKDKPNKCIEWTNRDKGEFRLIKTAVIADLWGQSKNRTCMTYEKMARAMRYYYKMKILEKVPHKRLHFRFGEKMLAKVLDTSTIKPLRHTSVCNNLPSSRTDQGGIVNGVITRRFSTPQAFHEETLIPRPASEGSIPVETNPIEGAKVPASSFFPYPSIRRTVNQLTPVIRPTNAEQKSPVYDGQVLSIGNVQRSSDSDNGLASYSGDDTPVSSPTSDSDGELVVDTDDVIDI